MRTTPHPALPEEIAPVGPLVVKLGGAALDDPAQTPRLWEALATLHRAHPGGVVLVHGGAKAVDRHLDRLGLATDRRDGIRLTPESQIDEVVAVLAGSLNKSLVGWVQRSGIAAVGLCLGDGRLARTVKADHYPFDAGRVGRIVGGDARLAATLLAAGFMPVLCSIGLDDDGRPLNVNADDAASGIASILGASGLILLTDARGVLDASGQLIPELAGPEIEARIASGEIHGGMIPKVRGALAAATSAGVPATIASWSSPDDLLRIALSEPAGTRILPASGLSAGPRRLPPAAASADACRPRA